MARYHHILMALDYSEQHRQVAEKASALAEQHRARLSIVHVLDNIAMPDTGYGSVISLQADGDNEPLDAEKQRFKILAERLGVGPANRWLVWGNPQREIVELAGKQQVDLIVVGSHGRHGLALLLGSTANAVIHHARCDVLAVRTTEALHLVAPA
ncbi:universal stress protein [Methylomarinum sp. Ch1-1]|uniref:Universal stress protein n=1 Tax=Methylomarinum roseum TaxID=3067653 RepID=A0AAU7NYQ2_9GAMM|nr:universal stress protein [Methylomarinum sp. Ch1-1]MDP4521825.1 universal stress protein [Methylomarinum sp. Ch1-1]